VRLPDAERAVVPVAKLRDYSLNPAHPEGKHKARVFRSALGLTTADAELLRRMILDAILSYEAVEQPPNAFGRRFVVDFNVPGVRGQVTIRSTWLIRNDEDFPRLTSCFIP
jgi:hypothetical protein